MKGGARMNAPTHKLRYQDSKPYAVPESLDYLQGPAEGTIELPLHVCWAPGSNSFKLSIPANVKTAYTALVAEGTEQDQMSMLNKGILIEYWPHLNLPIKAAKMWQNMFPELSGNMRGDW